MTGILRGPRRIALLVISALVAGATAASFAESYRALLLWARGHGLAGFWAAAWPLQVDTFVAVGELALFVALLDRWPTRSRAAAWSVTLLGLAVSVAGNVGHVHGHSLAVRGTAAIPPLAAAAALAVGLGGLKRTVAKYARPKVATTGHADKPKTAAKTKVATSATDTEAAVKSALAAAPDITTGQLAAMTGLSDRTVRRVRARLNGTVTTT